MAAVHVVRFAGDGDREVSAAASGRSGLYAHSPFRKSSHLPASSPLENLRAIEVVEGSLVTPSLQDSTCSPIYRTINFLQEEADHAGQSIAVDGGQAYMP
jgi:hypothetical protein